MAKEIHLVKRHGHTQAYDAKKVYASVYASFLNCHYSSEDAEYHADRVMKKISLWIDKRKGTVDSQLIRKEIGKHLTDEDVLMMYEEHLDIC